MEHYTALLVPLVDGVDLAPRLDPHVRVSQHELPDTGVQHEPVHTLDITNNTIKGTFINHMIRMREIHAGS